MKLIVRNSDLKPKFRNQSLRDVCFGMFSRKVQQIIEIVGRAAYYPDGTPGREYRMIYLPTKHPDCQKSYIPYENARTVICRSAYYYRGAAGTFGEPNYRDPNLTVGKEYPIYPGPYHSMDVLIINDAGDASYLPDCNFDVIE